MAIESFRELNRLRRAQNALEHLRAYAEARGVPDPDGAARGVVERVHAVGLEGEMAAAPQAGPRKDERRPRASGAGETRNRSSSARASTEPSGSGEGSGGGGVPRRLDDRTKEQLYARAQELDIEGRSSMTKEELIAAIRQKQ